MEFFLLNHAKMSFKDMKSPYFLLHGCFSIFFIIWHYWASLYFLAPFFIYDSSAQFHADYNRVLGQSEAIDL